MADVDLAGLLMSFPIQTVNNKHPVNIQMSKFPNPLFIFNKRTNLLGPAEEF